VAARQADRVLARNLDEHVSPPSRFAQSALGFEMPTVRIDVEAAARTGLFTIELWAAIRPRAAATADADTPMP
jgi:hypothetical protein